MTLTDEQVALDLHRQLNGRRKPKGGSAPSGRVVQKARWAKQEGEPSGDASLATTASEDPQSERGRGGAAVKQEDASDVSQMDVDASPKDQQAGRKGKKGMKRGPQQPEQRPHPPKKREVPPPRMAEALELEAAAVEQALSCSKIRCHYVGVKESKPIKYAGSLSSREALAGVVNSLFAADSISCGRGEGMHVFFVLPGPSDNLLSFPPLAQQQGASDSGWTDAASKARAVHVMQDEYKQLGWHLVEP